MPIRRRISRTVALLRYHRPSQFAWRFYRVVQRQIRQVLPERFVFKSAQSAARWKPGAKSAFAAIADRRFQLWPDRSAHAAQMAEGRFRFLGETRCLIVEPSVEPGADPEERRGKMDWNPEAPRLWRFHLQCQEDLVELANAAGPEAAYRVIGSWLSEPRHQSPTRDPDAWHPFCISRRLPVWLSLAAKYDPPTDISGEFWCSVTDQVCWLRKNCEWDLGGNHLLENLTAIYLAESFLELDHAGTHAGNGKATDSSATEGMLIDQLEQQILPTGEHYERTPTYHALMMVCVLQCIQAAKFRDSPRHQEMAATATRMTKFAKWIRRADRQFPLLSDSVRDETPKLNQLFDWADDLTGSGDAENDSTFDPSLDYWSIQTSRGDHLIFDTGPLACDHLPAHGHADLLQVTATLGGRDAIVDTGTSEYAASEIRQRCRQTSAHNVLQIGSREQCDVWSSFRMGRRGHPSQVNRGQLADYRWCSAMHDGFGCPSGRVVLGNHLSWTIIDWFSGLDGELPVRSRLHWHPEWHLVVGDAAKDGVAFHCDQPERRYSICALQPTGKLSVHDGFYCPNFGEKFSNQVLVNEDRFADEGWIGVRLLLEDTEIALPPMVEVVSLSRGLLRIAIDGAESIEISLGDGSVR